jgi:TQXA domain-containing protein
MRQKTSSSLKKRTLALFMTVAMVLGGGLFSFPTTYADNSTEGTVNYSAKWTNNGSAVELSVTPQNSGTVYYLMQDSGADAPDESSVKKNSSNCDADSATTIELSANTKTAKDIYVIYQDDGSSSSYAMSKLTLPAYDSSVSSAGTVAITAERNGSDQLSLSVTPTVDGTLYYIVKSADAEAPANDDFNTAAYISESANTTKTSQISLGNNPTEAKKLYLRYNTTDNGAFVETAAIDIPALVSSSFKAEIDTSELNLGTVLEGYSASDAAATATISNTGEGTVSFSVDTTADGYDTFSQYFNVDTSGAEDIASGKEGSVTVKPIEGLSAGTYSGQFSLVDQIGDNNLTLGPVTVTMTVVEKGTSTVEGVRTPVGEYTPSFTELDGTPLTISSTTSKMTIDDKVAYCANYNYILYTSNASANEHYQNQFSAIKDVTNKELDSYTGLDPNDNPVVYPPNNKGYTPVKEGSDDSEVRDQVAKVLYYGYPNDALGLLSEDKYVFNALIENRAAFTFEIATQCAIWHYTDNIDFSKIASLQQDDSRVTHVKQIYSTIGSRFNWGWKDVQNLYNFLVGNEEPLVYLAKGRGIFQNGVTYPSSLDPAPDDFAVDLFVANNPISVNNTNSWTQNLVTGSIASTSTDTTDVSVTKIWADQSNANGNRPSEEEFKDWIHLYRGEEDVTETYADNLTVKDNENNTYTVTYSGLPVSGYTYKIQEVIPDAYSNSYKISDGANSAENRGSIKNYTPTKDTPSISTTVSADNVESTSTKAVETSKTNVLVVDTVSYNNLTPGKQYTLQAQLMNITNGVTAVGEEETSTFTPDSSSGTQDISLGTLTLKPGHTYVVYETLYEGEKASGSPVAEHKDKTDKAQTVVVTSETPSISTTVSADGDESTSSAAVETSNTSVNVVDTVTYNNLTSGTTYILTGLLMDVTDTNNITSVGDAKTESFTPDSASGTQDIDLGTLTLKPGHTYVVYETLYEVSSTSATKVAEHKDKTDKAQTIVVTTETPTPASPSISTTVSADGTASTSTKAVETSNTSVKVVDTVTYKNLTSGTTYTLEGQLMDVTSGETAVGSAKTATFTPTSSSGTQEINLGTLTLTPGHTYVVYETLYEGKEASGTSVAEHKNKNDKAQTIVVTSSDTPSISTTVSADGTASTSSKAVETSNTKVKVVDKVTYKNLTSGTKYFIQGQLMDVTSGETQTGSAWATFTPTSANGTYDLDFGTQTLQPGHKYVVYETMYEGEEASGTPVAEHKDKSDKAQTIVVTSSDTPSISTTASADGVESTSEKAVETSKTSVLVVDTVSYKNLTPGKTYTLQGQLMDVTNGVTAAGSAKTVYFTPKTADGSEVLSLGTMELTPGHTYVVYESLYEGATASGTPVAEHKDKTDKAQTIVVTGETPTTPSNTPSVKTTVSVDGTSSTSSKAVETSNTNVKVVDTVFYENLTAGTKYTLKGQLMDVTSGESVAATATMTFTPDTTNGSVNLDFGSVNVQAGHKYVVYESLYEGETAEGTPVAEHKDKSDTAQTFIVTSGGGSAVTTESTNSANSNAANSNAAKQTAAANVKTGDTTAPYWLLALAGALVALFVTIRKRRSSNR